MTRLNRGYLEEDGEIMGSARARRGKYRSDIDYDNEYLWAHYNNDEYLGDTEELENLQIVDSVHDNALAFKTK